MKPQVSEGFGSDWIILHPAITNSELHGKEGVAIILFPETDEPSFHAVKKLYEAIRNPSIMRVSSDGNLMHDLHGDEEVLRLEKRLGEIINRIERVHQDIVEAGPWEK